MEYSAGLTSQLFWLQESRKTASYIVDGKTKDDIRSIAWEENIYQVKAEYRAIEVLNATYNRISTLPEEVCKFFAMCDIETAKIINLVAVMMNSRILFEFVREVYGEKLHLGETEITDKDVNVFFADKALADTVVAGWTESGVKKLKSTIVRILFEAGLVEQNKRPTTLRTPRVDYRAEQLLKDNGLQTYIDAIMGR